MVVNQPSSPSGAHMQALIADFMLVWLPAPSLNLSGGGGGAALKQNPVTGFFASCPDNAFQVWR
jgi:Protein RETICULATA-related